MIGFESPLGSSGHGVLILSIFMHASLAPGTGWVWDFGFLYEEEPDQN
jgi:hypothetical protein